MWKIRYKKLVIVSFIMLLQPILTPGSYALAKKRPPPKAYSFIAEGGKASQAERDGERKIPRLTRLKDFSKFNSYMGSELQKPELNVKLDQEMWKHIFRQKGSCNAVLAKTPSSVQEEVAKEKPELPPEDADEPESDSGQAPGVDAE